MWEPGLPDGQEKERQKLTRVVMVSDTHICPTEVLEEGDAPSDEEELCWAGKHHL